MNRLLMRPLFWLVLVVLGLFAFSGWQLYDLGKVRGVVDLAQTRAELSALKRKDREQAKLHRDMQEQLAILERSSQIDRQAAQAIKSELGELEDELQAAREEVEFYRGIVSPGDVNPGLRIHRFALENGSSPGSYHYDLVLTQLKRNDKLVSGTVYWKVIGKLAGEPGSLGLAEISHPVATELKFRFRYFQDLNGTVRLPDGFEAEQVEIRVVPDEKNKQADVVQKFDWPVQG